MPESWLESSRRLLDLVSLLHEEGRVLVRLLELRDNAKRFVIVAQEEGRGPVSLLELRKW